MTQSPAPTAQVQDQIAAPPDKVWRTLTSTAKMKRFFLGAEVDTDWREGSPIRFRGEFKGKPYEDKGEIRSFAPPHRLEFSHYSGLSGAPDTPDNYHLVRFELEPEGRGTRVTLTQANLNGEAKTSDREHRASYEKTWSQVLAGLKQAAEA